MQRQWRALVMLALAGAATGASAQTLPVNAGQHYDEALLSKPAYSVKVEIDVPVAMRDGVTLSADIYRPDAPGRFPAILVRTPYSNNADNNNAQSLFFAQRGYVVLQQDVRGKYDSKGDFYPFRHEPDDGYDMDEWIGRQPWFNGKLGTMGGSYTGFTQWGQAIRGSKYLVAMAPQFTTPDIYGEWMYVDGALNYAFALSWGAVSIDGRVSQTAAPPVDWRKTYRHLPILEAPVAAGHRAPHYRDWVTHPTRDAYWDTVSRERDHDKVRVPILSVGGWYDIFIRGGMKDFNLVRTKGATDPARSGQRLFIGPWVHGVSRRDNTYPNQPAPPGSTDFGPAATVDLLKLYLRWFDYWLKGTENGVRDEPPIKIFVMGENVWRYEREWPLARAVPTKYYIASRGHANTLDGDGRLSTTAPGAPASGGAAAAGEAETDTYNYDPNDPVPTLGGNSCCAAITPVGPWDQRPAEKRDDVLVFSTEVLTEPVEVTGPVTLTLFAATSAKDTDWTAKLVDVGPDGFARNVQEGIVRARYRETRGRGPASLVTPGQVYEYTIDMWAASNLFLPGHRIRLEISSSNFPRFDRNLNTGEDTATGTRMEVATQTIHHSARYPSHLVLPIVPRGKATSSDTRADAAPQIPNLAGKVLTVNGPIDPAQLGHTLTHEHIFIDFTVPDDRPELWPQAGRRPPQTPEARALYEAPLTMDILGTVSLGAANRDNYRLDSEPTAIDEVSAFKRAGGGTIVDVTSIGLKRRPDALRRVSRATGVNIVMGASWYTEAWYEKDLATRSVESLTEQIVRDVTVGVDGTDVRSGVIGEVGTSGKPDSQPEQNIIRASARASRLTGVPLTLHALGLFRQQERILAILEEEGADLSRVILRHSDFVAQDTAFLERLMARGVTIQFDLLGRPSGLARMLPPDTETAKAVVALVKAGHANQLLLSHDICTKTSLRQYGGTGYAYIEEHFLPYLKRQGVTEEQIHTMVVENPKRLLTFVAPRPLDKVSQ